MSLRWKIIIIYLIISILSLTGMGIYLYENIAGNNLYSANISNFTHANIVSDLISDYIGKNSYMITPTIENFSKQINSRVLLFNRDGNIVIDSSDIKSLEGHKPNIKEVNSALDGISDSGIYYIKGSGYIMYNAVPVIVGGKNDGVILLSSSIDSVMEANNSIKLRIIYLFVGTGVFISIISIFVAGFITRPLKKLTNAVDEMAGGHLGYIVDIYGKDEIGVLANSFNEMSLKLKHIDEARNKFVSDASHELKTPIAAIKALIEPLIESEPNIEVYKEFLEDINNELDRMARLVGQLLELTKLEKALQIQMQEKDLTEVIKDVLSDIKPLADNKKIALLNTDTGKVEVKINEDQIYRLIYNLVENSIKYSQNGAQVEAYALYDKGRPCIIVKDNGRGIESEMIPRIFERFTRVDKARSRKSGGAGLGLAIVKEIVDLHNAKINVSSTVGKGTTFRIIF